MKTFAVFAALLALAAPLAAQHDSPPPDNSKLEAFLGDWTGKASQVEMGESDATAKGSKYLGERFIKVDLSFAMPDGKLEAVGLLTTAEGGIVTGYFFASMAPDPVIATGKFDGKKLVLRGRPLNDSEELTFTFDFSVSDELTFTLDEPESEGVTMSAKLKRKKQAEG